LAPFWEVAGLGVEDIAQEREVLGGGGGDHGQVVGHARGEPGVRQHVLDAGAGHQGADCQLALGVVEHHDNAFQGKVTEVQWRGSSHRVFADVHGHEVRLDANELRNPPAIEDEVWLHFSAEDAVLIPATVDGAAR
jgi:hypothetical protein